MPEEGYQTLSYLEALGAYCTNNGYLSPVLEAEIRKAVPPLIAKYRGYRIDYARGARTSETLYAQMTPERCQKEIPQVIAAGNAQYQWNLESSRYQVQQQQALIDQASRMGAGMNSPVFCTQVGFQTICN